MTVERIHNITLWIFIFLFTMPFIVGCGSSRCKAVRSEYGYRCELPKNHTCPHEAHAPKNKTMLFIWVNQCKSVNPVNHEMRCALEVGHKGKHQLHVPSFHSKEWGECMIQW